MTTAWSDDNFPLIVDNMMPSGITLASTPINNLIEWLRNPNTNQMSLYFAVLPDLARGLLCKHNTQPKPQVFINPVQLPL
jgi:hypothetical protein